MLLINTWITQLIVALVLEHVVAHYLALTASENVSLRLNGICFDHRVSL